MTVVVAPTVTTVNGTRVGTSVTVSTLGVSGLGGVNVKAYGAKGDGSTNDTAAFSSARDAAGINGLVHVPSGTYIVVNLQLSIVGQSWELAPGAILKTLGTLTSDNLLRVSANDVTITGGTVDLAGAYSGMATALSVSAGAGGGGVDGFTIHHTTFRNTHDFALGCYDCSRVRVEACRFYDIYGACVYITNQGSGNLNRDYIVANNFMDLTSVPNTLSNFSGISLRGDTAARPLTDAQITGNVIRLPVPSTNGTFSGPIGYIWAKDFVVADNVLEGGDMGISIGYAVNGIISNNVIRNFYSVGIETPNTPANLTVTGNAVDAGAASVNQIAVSIPQGCAGETISNNSFSGFAISPGGSYIRCGGTSSQLVINNNVFKDTQGNTTVACVLLLPSGTFNSCVVDNNSFHGGASTGNRGLQLEGTVNGLVVDSNQATNLLHSLVWLLSSTVTVANLTLGINNLVNCGSPLLYALTGTATMTNYDGPLVRTTFSNANYTASPVDGILAQTGTLSAARVVTLPLANSVVAGKVRQLVDESGSATGTNTLSWARSGSDTINGGTGNAVAVNTARGNSSVMSDGTSKWTIV